MFIIAYMMFNWRKNKLPGEFESVNHNEPMSKNVKRELIYIHSLARLCPKERRKFISIHVLFLLLLYPVPIYYFVRYKSKVFSKTL